MLKVFLIQIIGTKTICRYEVEMRCNAQQVTETYFQIHFWARICFVMVSLFRTSHFNYTVSRFSFYFVL